MKKLYSLMLLAIMAIGVSFTAKAEWTATVAWDIPGSVVVYAGGFSDSNKVTIPAGATSVNCTVEESWSSIYVTPADGYMLKGAACEDDGSAIKFNDYYNAYQFDNAHAGHTIKIDCAKIEYDGSFTIDFQSTGTVSATLTNPQRKFNLEGGKQTYGLLTENPTTLSLSANTALASNYYVKKNGQEIEWSNFYGTLRLNDLAIADGDVIEVKYNDEEPIIASEQTKYTVTINYADQAAKDALSMIYNKTKRESITSTDKFEVVEGTQIQFSFNTFDYTVTVNGETLNGGTQVDKYQTWLTTIDANTTINISAKERDYGKIALTFMIDKPEYLIVHDGTIDGPIVDLSALTPITTTFNGVEYKKYTVYANAKYGKLFVIPAENCWFEKCVYDTDGEEAESGTVMADYTNFRIIASPIVRDQKLVIYVDSSWDPTKLNVRDRDFNKYPLEKGYNELLIDPKYSTPISIAPIDVTDTFTVLSDYEKVTADENGVYSSALHADGQVLHVFGKSNPAIRAIAINENGVSGSTVTIDKLTYTVEAGKTYSALNNYEVSVKPGAGYDKVLNGETEVELTDGVYTFKPSADTTITIESDPAKMIVTPAANSVVEEFEYILFTFPNATTAAQALDDDELIFANGGWGNYGWTIAQVEAEQGVAFTATPNFHTPNGTFRLYMPEGFFKINGQYNSEEIDMNFTVKRPVTDFEYQFSPFTEKMVTSDWGINVAVVFNEEYQVSIVDKAGITVKFNGKDVTNDSKCMFDTEGNYFMVMYLEANATGTLSLSIAEGALAISGEALPAISHDWEVVAPKEYTIDTTENWTPEQGLAKDGEFEFVITFVGADSAELFEQNMIILQETGYPVNRYYQVATNVEAVNPEIQTYATSAAADPSFKLTFPSLKSVKGENYDYSKPVDMKLEVREGAFNLDGYAPSPAIEKTYSSFLTTGIANLQISLDGEAHYYNLQGVEVKNPVEGQVYIKVTGKKATKVQL